MNANVFDTDELVSLLKKYKLTKNEMRSVLRTVTKDLYNKEQSAIGSKWGVRTGRLSREGIKMGVSSKDETETGAAYRIYFSKKSGQIGTSEYMADTFKARWLEGGTKPHFTAKGATLKKARSGRLSLSDRQRKLMHPGFTARPVIENTVSANYQQAVSAVRNLLTAKLIKKGAKRGDS